MAIRLARQCSQKARSAPAYRQCTHAHKRPADRSNICDGAVSTPPGPARVGHRERTPRITDVPEGGFAHIGELHDEVRCANVVTEHDGRTGFRVWEAVRLNDPGQAKGRHFLAGFDVFENLRGGLGINAERADLMVISQPSELVLSYLPKCIDRCRIGLRGAIGDQDMAGRRDSAC